MIKGKAEPRIWTPPLRKLTKTTTLGYMYADFCESIGDPLLPWQKWLSIHALEIVGDLKGEWHFRFRYVVVLVGRQNGKTFWFRDLGLFFNFILKANVIGTAQNLDLSNSTFEDAVSKVEETAQLEAEFDRALRGAGKREFYTKSGEYWKVLAASRKARGWSAALILLDETREQNDWEAWGALSKIMLAQPSAMMVTVSNAGDATSVVLRHLRMQAHAALGDPDGIAENRSALGGEDVDDALGLFEWSAEPGVPIDDKRAWAQANPALGYGRLTERAIKSAMMTDPEDVFRTECLCQWVESLLPEPFPDGAWLAGVSEGSRIAATSDLYFGIDMSTDRRWVSIGVCGQREDGNYHIEVVARRVGSEWALDWIRERAAKQKIRLAFQSRGAPISGTAEQICTIKGVERIAIEGGELPAGWGRFFDGVAACAPGSKRGGAKIYHLPQPVIDAPAKTMQLRSLGGGTELPDRTKSPDDISPLFACIMAYSAATAVTREDKKIYESAYANGASLMFV